MARAFRLSLRAAVILLILTGVALVVYATVSDRHKQRLQRAGSAQQPTAPGAQVTAEKAGPTEAVEPGTRPVESPAREGAEDAEGEARRERRSDMQSEVVGFTSVLRDHEEDREEAMVQGDRAVLRDKIWHISVPLVIAYLWPREGEPLDVELEKVRVNAERAELDEAHGVVRLFENVRAQGEDFEIGTESVVYRVTQRTLTSDKPVRIQKDRIDKDGNRTPALVVNGQGLDVDMALGNMTILEDVEARLYGVSTGFLGAELDEATQEEGLTRGVVITSDGKMLYEHLGRKVNFFENVRATSGQRTLTCNQLTVLLSRTEEKGKLVVSGILATDSVQLTYMDQIARGAKLEWHNVTQTGVVTGEPAVLIAPEFEIAGEELTFYRVNERFHSEGPGTLLWKALQEDPPTPEETQDEGGWDLGPPLLKRDAPVEVTWKTSMTYHVAAHKANFEGQVIARQEQSSLSCERLVLTFEPDTNQMQEVEAEQDVRVHDRLTEGDRDVTSDRLLWDPVRDTVELMAREGEAVNVTTGQHSIISPHVILDNANQSLECPASGRLIVRPLGRETTDEDEAEPPVIEVEWQKAMHFAQRPAPVALFSGQATARREGQLIKAEELRVEFDQGMAPLSIVATGDAVMDVRSGQPEPERPPAGVEADAAEPEQGAILPVASIMEGGRWRLGCDELVIVPPEELISSPTAGLLTALDGDATTGTIGWQERTQLDLANNLAEFYGKVCADVSGGVLEGDQLRLEFDDAKNLRHMRAEGDVHFAGKEENAWELSSGSAEAVLAAGSELRQVIARDNVQVRDQTRTLTSQLLQLFFGRVEGKERPVIRRAIFEGDVTVNWEQDEPVQARGDRLEWDRDSDTYVLTGDPEAHLRRGGVTLVSDKIIVDRATGEMHAPPGARPARAIFTTDVE